MLCKLILIFLLAACVRADDIYNINSHPFWQVEDNESLEIFKTTNDQLPKGLKLPLIAYQDYSGNNQLINVIGIDLNNDKKLEYFVEIPKFGGSGGRFYFIYYKKDLKWVSIGHGQGSFKFRKAENENGWVSIIWFSRGGAGGYSRVENSFDGNEFIKKSHFIIDNGKIEKIK